MPGKNPERIGRREFLRIGLTSVAAIAVKALEGSPVNAQARCWNFHYRTLVLRPDGNPDSRFDYQTVASFDQQACGNVDQERSSAMNFANNYEDPTQYVYVEVDEPDGWITVYGNAPKFRMEQINRHNSNLQTRRDFGAQRRAADSGEVDDLGDVVRETARAASDLCLSPIGGLVIGIGILGTLCQVRNRRLSGMKS